MRRRLPIFLCALCAWSALFARERDSLSRNRLLTVPLKAGAEGAHTPAFTVDIHGTVRSKFEYCFETGKGRFQVRNARFSLTGEVTPVVAYKVETDFSDEGRIRTLDAYVQLRMLRRRLRLSVGQMRVPFSLDAHRSPHQQYFANRSFIAKQAGNFRDVGATLGYFFVGRIPVTVVAGIFNGSGTTGQKDYWTGRFDYSLRVQSFFGDAVGATVGFKAARPDAVRILMYDAAVDFHRDGLHLEAEYLHKRYAHGSFPGADAFNGVAGYDFRTKRFVRKITLLARYDYLSDHSSGVADDSGTLRADDPARHRMTCGCTFGLDLPFRADIRLNYERSFYDRTVEPSSGQERIVVEFMARF